MNMELSSEVERLHAVYKEYGERGWGSTKWATSNLGNRAIQQERERQLEKLLRQADLLPLDDRRILDVGCGEGANLARFQTWGGRCENLFGVDLLLDRVGRARQKFPGMNFQAVNAEALPFANDSFDLVSTFTVFTSILDRQMAANVSREIDRVLRKGGAVVWYDFRLNNPRNPHVRGIARDGVSVLFPGYESRLITITLLPPLARRLGRLAKALYPCLASVPLLRSHHLGVLRKF